MTQRGRLAILPRLGLRPSPSEAVRARLDEAFSELAGRRALAADPTDPGIDALDAGCGRFSILTRYRARIRRLVGADIHAPSGGALSLLDEFVTVDLCGDPSPIADRSFDIVLSSFTVEHFGDPAAAFANVRRWLRPGGHLILTTVNRRHPFVALYLGLPERIQRWLQGGIKASAADAHPLVGACNDPRRVQASLEAAGYSDVRVVTVANLARAWHRRWPAFALGLLGDLATQPFASRRSTIVADARAAG